MKISNRLVALVFAVMFVASVSYANDQKCTYSIDQKDVKVGWTAFKTTQKVGVNGSFTKTTLKGAAPSKSMSELFNKLEASVDKLSVDTGNPARDKTLSDFFFGKLTKSISGKIKDFSDKNTFVLTLNINGRKKDVPMHYEISDDQTLKATGGIDLVDFGAKSALSSLNEKCTDLHKGADGVSKTWSEVTLNLSGKISRVCQ